MPSQDDTRRNLDRATSDFLSVVAHKIHTPITAITWQVETLLSPEESKNCTEEQLALLRGVMDAAVQLNDLSRSLMYVFELEKDLPMMKMQDVSICALVQRAANHLAALAKEKGVRVESVCTGEKLTVYVDPELAFMILRTLIENAIQYSPTKSDVLVNVASDAAGTRVCVADHGCGIPNDLKDRVFTKFFRAPQARKLWTDGVGLDLFVAKSIAERTGGDLTFESSEGKGSTFCWRIPAHRQARAPWER